MTSTADARPATSLQHTFVAAMGNAATGVTVVATDGTGGRFAQTVSAMCSVSAEPPTVLVCVNVRSPLVEAIARHGVFTVNVLADDQAHVADTFAGRPSAGAPYDFGCAEWAVADSGSPALLGAAAVFDCTLAGSVRSGTHRVFLGTVNGSRAEPTRPLVYHARRYGRHEPLVP